MSDLQGHDVTTPTHSDELDELSALMDGEVSTQQVGQVTAKWRESADVRERWHAWSVIGDVLRSDDLATSANHDAAFLQNLRLKLAQEPVVLAPQTPDVQAKARQRWPQWLAPTAVAASFVAVAAGALVGLHVQDVPGAGSTQSMFAVSPQPNSAINQLWTQRSNGDGSVQPVFIVISAPAQSNSSAWQPVHLRQDFAAQGMWVGSAVALPSSSLMLRVNSEPVRH